jgi:flagellar protein FliO/FliZ
MLTALLLVAFPAAAPVLQDVRLTQDGPVTLSVDFSAPLEGAGVDVRPAAPSGFYVFVTGAHAPAARVHLLEGGWRALVHPVEGNGVELQVVHDEPRTCAMPMQFVVRANTVRVTGSCNVAVPAAETPRMDPAPHPTAPPMQEGGAAPDTRLAVATGPADPVRPLAGPLLLSPTAQPAEPPAVWALLALATLGAAAWILAKRRAGQTGVLQLVQTQSLGAKRALVVARVGKRLMLLSTSESGIQLLTDLEPPQPATPATPGPAPVRRPGYAPEVGGPTVPHVHPAGPLPDAMAQHAAPALHPSEFEALLELAGEEAVLRNKLRTGSRGRLA